MKKFTLKHFEEVSVIYHPHWPKKEYWLKTDSPAFAEKVLRILNRKKKPKKDV